MALSELVSETSEGSEELIEVEAKIKEETTIP